MKKLILLALLISFTPLFSQTDFSSKMDSLFDALETHDKAMASISLFKNGNEIYARSIGYENLENNTKTSAKTIYRIGSISKTFTATLIVKMAEEGKISLDEKLAKYFPEVKNADKITLEHLLRHESGIFNYTNDPSYLSWHTEPISREALLQKIAAYNPVFSPGEKSEYSNSNYALLTLIAEKASNKTFDELLKQHITEPCKLLHTYVGKKANAAKNEALSYSKVNGWQLEDETDMSVPLGAGAIVSTAADLNRFFHCLFQGTLVSQESLKQMKQTSEKFGMGLFRFPLGEKSAQGHNGGIDGFQSNAAYFESEGVSVSYLSNGVDYPMNNIVLAALNIYFGLPQEIPTFAPSIKLSNEELDAFVGEYSSDAMPLKITISNSGKKLMAQATGQGAFPLECYETNKFKFEPAMVDIEFSPEKDAFILRQGGGEFKFVRVE